MAKLKNEKPDIYKIEEITNGTNGLYVGKKRMYEYRSTFHKHWQQLQKQCVHLKAYNFLCGEWKLIRERKPTSNLQQRRQQFYGG